jgi:O-antigen ligase
MSSLPAALSFTASAVSAPNAAGAWWQRQDGRPQAGAVQESTANRVAFRALLAFTAILLLSPQIWFPVLGTLRIAFVAAGLAIAALVTQRMAQPQAVTPSFPEIGIAIALVGWSMFTIPVSYWPGGSVNVLTDHYLKAVAFFWLIGTVVSSAPRLRMLAWVLVLCSVPLAATGVHHYLYGVVLSTGVPGLVRISGYDGGSGLVGNPNDLALMLNLIIPIATGLMLSERRAAHRWVAAGAVLLSATAVILTFSRAGFLTLAATFIMFLGRLAWRRAPGKAASLLLAGLVVLPFLPAGYADRLSTITNVGADRTGSALGRLNDYQIALGVVASHPIMGVGIGQDILAMNESRGDDWVSVHNVFLQYAVDLGLPGLLLFLWLYLTCFRSARAVERRAVREPLPGDLVHIAAAVQIALVAFGVASFFHPIAYQFYFFSIGGLAVALKHAYLTERARASVAPLQAS